MKRRTPTPTGGDDSPPLASHLWDMKTSLSRIARSSVDRVWPGERWKRFGECAGYVGSVFIRWNNNDRLPLRDEGMLEMEATGESQGGCDGDAIDHLPVAKFSVTMTGLGTIRLTKLPQPIEPSPSGY